MSTEENEIMGLDHQHISSDDTLLNFPSSTMNTIPVSSWDPIVSLSQIENFGGSSMIPQNDFGMVQYQTDSGLSQMVPKLPCFGNGSFSEMVNSFGLAECGQASAMRCPQNYPTNGEISKGEQVVSDDILKGKCGKGKRGSESNSPQSNSKGEQRKMMSCDSPEQQPTEHDDKRQKIAYNSGTNVRGKQTGKQVKDGSKIDDSAKEDYIHVRARRGQATNSHSLAERVRREKISERMRLLQDLVPGCNKITGKAVMLDEIINYVQSLQQQVEFLSMKFATVNPELNLDFDRIMSKELLNSPGGNVAIPGFGSGINPLHPYPPNMSQGPLPGLSNTSPFHQMPQQNPWDSEIQSLLQMGFDSYPSMSNLGPNGRPKLDL